MVDILPSVEGDSGPREIVPVMIFGGDGLPSGPVDTDGNSFNPDSLPLTVEESGAVTTYTVTDGTDTWVKTKTIAGNTTTYTGWVKQ